jgi:cysteinyl-tRNA synthetase
MLRFTGEKMSKSLGNVTTIREALDASGRETMLVYFLSAHWRKPVDYSDETVAQAAARAETLRNAFRSGDSSADEAGWDDFAAALDDDFDTPAALAVLHEWGSSGKLGLLERGLRVFGLETLAEREDAPAEIVDLAERRALARRERDFAAADRLRAEIESAGWEMRDSAAGFTLVRRS